MKKVQLPYHGHCELPVLSLPFPFKVPLSRHGPSLWGPGAEDEGKMDVGGDRGTIHVSPGLLAHISVIGTQQGALDIFCLRRISDWGLPPPPPI